VLQPRFEGLVHPSKLYGIMAAGRPTIFVGDCGGETAAILEACACGLSVAAVIARPCAQRSFSLRADAALRARMGAAAREGFDRLYARDKAFTRWTELLHGIARVMTSRSLSAAWSAR
jgi:hypothetical protein